MPDSPQPDPLREHYELIGSVAVAWNDVQRLIYLLFQHFSELPSAKAHAIYGAIGADRTQRRIVLALGRIVMAGHPDLINRLSAVLRALDRLAEERNAAIHTSWGIDLQTRTMAPANNMPVHSALKEDFVAQFRKLKDELRDHFFALHHIYVDHTDRHPELYSEDYTPQSIPTPTAPKPAPKPGMWVPPKPKIK